MSFSSEVKEELSLAIGGARHCKLAEMGALWRGLGGHIYRNEMRFRARPYIAAKKLFTIFQKAYNIDAVFCGNSITSDEGTLREACAAIEGSFLGRSCCRRAFLRGVFLCGGTVSDPSKSYRMEFALHDGELARLALLALEGEGIKGSVTLRGGRSVVYLRDGEDIVLLLGYMEAGRALLRMESARVTKDVRGNINRRVNLETANLGKAAEASARQVAAIEWLFSEGRGEELPDSLREVALARLSNPEATLEELGRVLCPAVGKSGVNHRLRRIVTMAREMGFDPERMLLY